MIVGSMNEQWCELFEKNEDEDIAGDDDDLHDMYVVCLLFILYKNNYYYYLFYINNFVCYLIYITSFNSDECGQSVRMLIWRSCADDRALVRRAAVLALDAFLRHRHFDDVILFL
jgi:hypothetical protein